MNGRDIENSTIADYEREHAGDIQPETIDAECEEMAAHMLATNDAALLEWLEQDVKRFLPAMRAARRGDKEFAAKVLAGICEDWQNEVVDSTHFRDRAYERIAL